MRVLDLFSGIGGFTLGLERAGFETAAFCEIDKHAQAILRKHWPEIPCYEDVTKLTAERLVSDGIGPIDVITGGFPCQDISRAGSGIGILGKRSGLWSEVARLIGELRPKYAIMENVTELLGRGMDVVLKDLSALGYDAEWHCIPASSIGAPHPRERIWIVAYPNSLFAAGDISSEIGQQLIQRWTAFGESGAHNRWSPEPNVGRVVDGVPTTMDRDRISSLGNAVVPQIPELIGKAIMEHARKK